MDERGDYAVLISLSTREEAEVAASALRADGIDAFVGNGGHATNDWFATIALGGLQILVPRARLMDAREALRVRIWEVAQQTDSEPVLRRDRWKLWLLVVWWVAPIALALVGFYLLLITGRWDKIGRNEQPGVERPFDLDPYS